MVSLEEMRELVRAHAALDEPMDTAVWIRQRDRAAWLVEVLPDMPPDVQPERPVLFNPGRTFRYPLYLLAGCLDDVHRALETDSSLAQAVANGQVLHGDAAGEELRFYAQALMSGQSRAG